MRKRYGLGGYATLCLVALFADLVLKRAARCFLSGKNVPLILGLRLKLHLNPGVAFGLSPAFGWAVGLIGLGTLIVLSHWARKWRCSGNLGLSLLWAGGLSNVLERFFLGGVTDFLFVPLPYLPFLRISGLYVNLADLWLVLGAALLVLGLVCRVKGGGDTPSAEVLKAAPGLKVHQVIQARPDPDPAGPLGVDAPLLVHEVDAGDVQVCPGDLSVDKI